MCGMKLQQLLEFFQESGKSEVTSLSSAITTRFRLEVALFRIRKKSFSFITSGMLLMTNDRMFPRAISFTTQFFTLVEE
jgi:hypothetical protein